MIYFFLQNIYKVKDFTETLPSADISRKPRLTQETLKTAQYSQIDFYCEIYLFFSPEPPRTMK